MPYTFRCRIHSSARDIFQSQSLFPYNAVLHQIYLGTDELSTGLRNEQLLREGIIYYNQFVRVKFNINIMEIKTERAVDPRLRLVSRRSVVLRR
jgi:hypothetical protein